MSALAVMKPKTAAEKHTHSTVDTIELHPEAVAKWKLPSGQRPLRENAKVRAITQKITDDGGVVPGIITLGIFDGIYWIIDGQHRLHAFTLSGLKIGYADVRFIHADSMADINCEFVELNSKLVSMRPDDFLRGLEGTLPFIAKIREACPYIGYDQIRRGTYGPIISMAFALRSWRGSSQDTPVRSIPGMSAVDLAQTVTEEETTELINFLTLAHAAFGHDAQYVRLWSGVNLTLCMWLYRKMVLMQYSPKTPQISPALYRKCLMSVSADTHYQDWLVGRILTDRDRPPAYARLKAIFAKRLSEELNQRVMMPAPDWAGK